MKSTSESRAPFGSPLIGLIAIPVILLLCGGGIYLGFYFASGIDRFGNWAGGGEHPAARNNAAGHPAAGGSNHAPAGNSAGGNEHAAPEVAFAPPFQDWPKENPDFVFVLSGEQFGHLRPCGCSPDQLGGIARRSGFLKFLRETKKWSYLCVDLGDLIEKNGPLEKLRYSYAVQMLMKLGYKSLGIGKRDLSLSFANVIGEALNSDPMKFAQANLEDQAMGAIAKQAGCLPDVNFVEQSGVKIGISSVMGDSHAKSVPDPSVKVTSQIETAKKLLAEMTKSGAQVKFLMAYMPFAEGQALAKAVPGFDLIMTQSTIEDAAASDAVTIGGAKVFWVGQKGKSVGVIGCFLKSKKFELEIVALDKHRFEDDDKVNKLYGDFVRQIKQQQIILTYPKMPLPDGEQYVGATKCGECHKKAFAKWNSTGHAHALATLQDIKKTPFVGQDHNPECIKCHTLGFDNKSGFVSVDKTPTFGGNQCENCHGPGSRHSASPKNNEYLSLIRKGRHTIKETCMKCHDIENSPHFDFDKYWPKIAHPGKD